jgi:hypothetical protein
MPNEKKCNKPLKTPLILCCHCVYDKGNIYSEFPEDRAVYEQHLRESVKALHSGLYEALIISGGYTKKQVEKSEARGMLDWAHDLALAFDASRVILEEYARDSFENVLFGMCRFYQEYHQFPEAVTICSWKPKESRFRLIADGLQIPNYSFFGIGKKNDVVEREADLLKLVYGDPLHRQRALATMRRNRDPWGKGNPYNEIEELREMFEVLSFMEEKGLTDSSLLDPPWTRKSSQPSPHIGHDGKADA